MKPCADLHRAESPISASRRRRLYAASTDLARRQSRERTSQIKRFGNVQWQRSFARYYISRCIFALLFLLAAVVFRRVVTTGKEGITEITGKVDNALVSTPPNRLAVPKSTIARIRTRDTADPP